MLILSQDKRTIVNLDNMKTIELDRITDFKAINIFRETNEVKTGVCGLYIGKYDTEERAKEVLQEIITSYREIESYKIIKDKVYNDIIMKNTFVYEMPKR